MQNTNFDMSFEQRLARIDLSKVMEKVVAENGLSAADAVIAEGLYRKFLTLISRNPGKFLVPPAIVDPVWHEHITNTRQYMADCELLFGEYLHHNPSNEDLTDHYRAGTVAMLERDFGIKLDTNDSRYFACSCGA